MFVGHALLAFVLAAGLARLAGLSRERTLTLGLFAATFGAIPDVDILYAPVGVIGAQSVFEAVDAFWQTGNVVHRAVTHSVVIGAVLAGSAALWSRHGLDHGVRGRVAGVVGISAAGSLVVLTAVISGSLAALVMAVFGLAVLATATVATGYGMGPREVLATAAIGLVSHPLGDLFTGDPPPLLYPIDITLVAERLTLHPDPTLHLLIVFGIEIAIIWLAVVVYYDLRGYSVREFVGPRATLGLGYAGAVVAIPAPTVDAAYLYVVSVLAVGAVGLVCLRRQTRGDGRRGFGLEWVGLARRHGALVTGLTAITIAWLAYATAYLVT